MQKVGIKQFRGNIRYYLANLPLGLTKKDHLIGLIVPPDFFEYLTNGTVGTEAGDNGAIRSGVMVSDEHDDGVSPAG